MSTLELGWRLGENDRIAGGLPIDASALRPDRLCAMRSNEVSALRIGCGRDTVALGELFLVKSRSSRTERLVVDGATPRLWNLADGMAAGELRVVGSPGPYLGARMTGGTLQVTGPVGDYCGSGMRGVIIRIVGDVGEMLGGAPPGHAFGMRGGEIHVAGRVGKRAGDRMRRGIIRIDGDSDGELAYRMLAGTILIHGDPGPDCAYELRHGSIIAGQAPSKIPSTLADTGTHRFGFLVLMANRLRASSRSPHIDSPGLDDLLRRMQIGIAQRWLGDLAIGGRGELLVLPA